MIRFGSKLLVFILCWPILSFQGNALDELPPMYTAGDGVCYSAPVAYSAQALVDQIDAIGNATAANPCGAPVVCTNPFTITNVSETSYSLTSDCTGQGYTWGIWKICPQGYNLNTSTNKCERVGNTPDKQPNSCPSATTRNPINISTGNKYLVETDYTGTSKNSLKIIRYYNSDTDLLSSPSKTSSGNLWKTYYDRQLSINTASTPSVIIAHRHTGKANFFKYENSEWVADADVVSELSQSGSDYFYKNVDNSVEQYSSSGVLQSIEYVNSVTETLTYDVDGRLTSVTDNFGKSLAYTYDANNRISTITDPDSNVFTYEYNDYANLQKVIYPTTEEREYLYENTSFISAVTGIINENGDRISTYTYDTQGRATQSKLAGNVEQVDLVYNTDGTVTVTDSLGASNTYSFVNSFGVLKTSNLTGGQCASGCSNQGESQTYDTNGYLASLTDFNGNTTTYINNSRGLKISRTEASGTTEARTITTEWHTTLRLPTKITDNGKETTFTYNSTGQTLTRTEKDLSTSNTRTTTFTYDSNGNVLTIDGPRTDINDIATFTYDSSGNRATMSVDPDGAGSAPAQITNFTSYDNRGRLLSMTDPNGVVTTQSYDARGRLQSRTIASSTTTFDYDGVGNVTKITLPNNSFLSYTYDVAQRLTNIEDNLGNKISYTLDSLGNRTKEDVFDDSSVLRRTQSRVFDQLSHMTQATGGASQLSIYGYDGNGNQTSLLDPLNRISTSEYDALNRLIKTIDPDNFNKQYAYDARDNLTSVTDTRSNVTSYIYDNLENLTQLNSPDTGITNYTYDSAGNRLTQTDARSITTTHTYDALNRLTSISYPNTSLNVTFSYDQGVNGIGRLTGMTDAGGTTTYIYDARGNLTSETKIISSQNYVTSYTYDAADNITQIIYPSGLIIDYTRNAIGQITAISTPVAQGSITIASNITYLPFGALKNLTFGNGITQTLTYDLDYRLTNKVADIVQNLTFGLDAANNITSITDALATSKNQVFSYDNLDQLTSASGIYGSLTYTYDALGNRTSFNDGANLDTYTIDSSSNRLTSITGGNPKSFSYDNTGNIINDGSTAFTYGDHNRMVSSSNTGNSATYTYNGKGERTIKTLNGTTTIYHFDQNGNLLAETDNQGNPLKDYIYLDGSRVSMITDGIVTGSVNSSPNITNPGNQTNNDIDTGISLAIQANDPDVGDNLTFSATNLPTGLSISSSSGIITGDTTTSGNYSVTVTVSDGSLSASTSFNWIVNNVPFGIYSPVDGSTLTSASQTFAWAGDGTAVDEWWLYVGTSVGSKNLYDSSVGTATSVTVNNLSEDGSTLYVTLWWRNGSTWQSTGYTYTAFTATPPEITIPTPGNTLTGSSETFTWTANSSTVTEWWLYVGTSADAKNILDSGSLGTSTSITVNNLPVDGSTLYVTLWWRNGSNPWESTGYTYTAFNGSAQFEFNHPDSSITLYANLDRRLRDYHPLDVIRTYSELITNEISNDSVGGVQ